MFLRSVKEIDKLIRTPLLVISVHAEKQEGKRVKDHSDKDAKPLLFNHAVDTKQADHCITR